MKKLLLIIGVIFLLFGCKKTTIPKEEYIPMFVNEDKTYYIASPSGTIVFSTDSETYYTYVKDDGSVANIKDYMEAHNEED